MSNKTASDPRRLYTRYGILHTYLSGKCYGTSEENSKIDVRYPVKLEPMPSDGKRARVSVSQRKHGEKTVTETWRTCSVPRKHRTEA